MSKVVPSPRADHRARCFKVLLGSVVAGCVIVAGCAGRQRDALEQDLDRAETNLTLDDSVRDGSARDGSARASSPSPPSRKKAGGHAAPKSGRHGVDGKEQTLGHLVAIALKNNPSVEADFHRWKAATLSIKKAGRLPDPVFSYAYFVRSVETRVGPQRHRFSLKQTFPWPTQLTKGTDAASARARAAQARFEAHTTEVTRRVADSYYELWRISEEHRITSEHLVILETLSQAVQGRLEVGEASLAELNQLELRIATHRDHHGAHAQERRMALAELEAAVGVNVGTVRPAADAPSVAPPSAEPEELRKAAWEHPRVTSHQHLAEASEDQASALRAKRYPSFSLGVDYIETGPAATAVTDSGKDPIIVGAGVSLPLWQGSYADEVDAAQAEARAHRADQRAAEQLATAQLERVLAQLDDARRRVELYESTLIPQATTTYESVVGAYQTGRAGIADLLMAQKDLLSLREELIRQRARYAKNWALLESIVGHPVERSSPATQTAPADRAPAASPPSEYPEEAAP